LGNGEANGKGVAGFKPWRQFMVEMQIQRVQEARSGPEAGASAIQHTIFEKTGVRYD
jgi:hypothetical protein